MYLTFRNAEAAHVDPASEPKRLDVNIEGVKVDDILFQINIIDAINYYGITELLDSIGNDEIRSHISLDLEEENENYLKTPSSANEANDPEK